ncbi:hypothetical protein [Crenothrix sp.]|uniref:hypothetical protein n=1 Tax=Crenothrix sp. TaxID=3100433 RepID=UPI00374D9384
MNTKNLKNMATALSMVAGMGIGSSAMAVNTGIQTLGNGNTVDAFTFTCPAGSGGRARVNDRQNPNPVGVNMQVAIGHDSFPTRQAVDATDNGVPSAFTVVIAESGAYAATFKKTGAAAEIYSGDLQCCNIAGNCAINPFNVVRRINQ